MAKYEIKMSVDAAQAIKPAEDTAKAFAKVATSVKSTGDELKKVDSGFKASGESAKKLGKDIEGTGAETEKLTRKKEGLFQGVKKLGNAFPVLGAALNALKNPFTLVAAAGLIAKKLLDDYVASIERLAEEVRASEGDRSKLLRFFQLVAETKADETAFEKRLKKIATEAQTAKERLEEVKTLQDQMFAAEEKAGAKPGLEIRKGVASTVALRNAERQEKERAERLLTQLPGARQQAQADEQNLMMLTERQRLQESDDAAEEARLIEQKRKLGDVLTGGVASFPAYIPGLGLVTSEEKLRAGAGQKLDEIDFRLGGIGKGRSLRGADLIRAKRQSGESAGIAAGLERDIEEASISSRQFGRQAASTARISDAATAPLRQQNLANQQFVDRRADAILEELRKISANTAGARQAQSDAHAKAASQNTR